MGEVPPIVNDVLRSPGHPLDSSTRDFMESRFGHDFGNVHIHTGSKTARLARSLNARAFTIGNNIVFGTNEFNPQNNSGRSLLAHELTHIIQQSNGTSAQLQRACKDLDASFRKRHDQSIPMNSPCHSRNSNDCCDTVLNCDRRRELELALSRAVQRLKTAKSKLGKTIIERQLRQIFRQLMGRRRFKEQVVNRIEDAYKWLDNATIAKRGDSPPVDSESSTNHEEEILREAKPDDDIEFPHDIGGGTFSKGASPIS